MCGENTCHVELREIGQFPLSQPIPVCQNACYNRRLWQDGKCWTSLRSSTWILGIPQFHTKWTHCSRNEQTNIREEMCLNGSTFYKPFKPFQMFAIDHLTPYRIDSAFNINLSLFLCMRTWLRIVPRAIDGAENHLRYSTLALMTIFFIVGANDKIYIWKSIVRLWFSDNETHRRVNTVSTNLRTNETKMEKKVSYFLFQHINELKPNSSAGVPHLFHFSFEYMAYTICRPKSNRKKRIQQETKPHIAQIKYKTTESTMPVWFLFAWVCVRTVRTLSMPYLHSPLSFSLSLLICLIFSYLRHAAVEERRVKGNRW